MIAEYIEREAVLAEYDRQHKGAPGGARKIIAGFPATDVAPVVHGHWEFEYENLMDELEYACSVCDWIGVNAKEYHYCPACGAKMDEED